MTSSTSELVRYLVGLIRAKNGSTFYLNGPPGSGKSYLLGELARQLPTEIPHTVIFGPYSITQTKITELGKHLVQDFRDARFLDKMPVTVSELDLMSAWQWFGENAHISPRQTLVVLVDLEDASQFDLPTLGNLFSSARCLEGIWQQRNAHISHIFAGYWDHPGLEHYFQRINTSFPYTVSRNYAVWDGLSAEEIATLVEQVRPGEAHLLHSRVLFELTGGHPAAALDILDQIPAGDLGCATLLTSTRLAATNGSAGQALLNTWRQLPVESRSRLRDLVLQRRIPAATLLPHLERLRIAGAIRLDQIGTASYLNFRSWYIELLVRLHTEELEITNEQTRRVRIDELMPKTSELNVEAYRLINNIENQARNFVTIQLCLRKPPSEHILQKTSTRYDQHEQAFIDVYDRAIEWQAHSADKGLPTALNPLLAYLSTRDLADVIEDIGIKMDSKAWQRIAQAIRDLAGVRDAVMHNQIIDDAALQRLYDLQADIYKALSETE